MQLLALSLLDRCSVSLQMTHREMHQKEFEAREELDDSEAVDLLKKIKAKL